MRGDGSICPKCKKRQNLDAFDISPDSNRRYSYCRHCRDGIKPVIPDPNPSGICQCGCGGTVTADPKSGRHYRLKHGHSQIRQDPIAGRYAVVDLGYITPCHVWTGRRLPNGYGVVSYRNKRWLVHRLVHTMANGDIPPGLQSDHLCGQGHEGCCRLDHLESVTSAVNTRRSKRVKMSVEKVRDARQRRANGETCASIARRHGVSQPTIRYATTVGWRDID